MSQFGINDLLLQFIKEHTGLIEQGKIEELYDKLNSTRSSKYRVSLTGELSDLLYSAGIDPLTYLSEIPEGFLRFSEKVRSLAIPSRFTTINFHAFDTSQLEELSIQGAVRVIPEFMCRLNKQLEKVSLPDTVEIIERGAFDTCSSLSEIQMPKNLKTIEFRAFCGCTSLRTLNFPDSLETIDKAAFYECISLQSVSFGPRLKSIERDAFSGCKNLKQVTYRGTMDQWEKIEISAPGRKPLLDNPIHCIDGDYEYED